MRTLFVALSAVAVVALPATAQQAQTISPGMTASEVRSTFGAPALVREQGGWSYLFYTNSCLPRCGSDDVVFLQDGRVVAAVLRSPRRRFTGPAAAAALRTVQPAPRGNAPERAAVRGVRVETRGDRQRPANLGVIRGDPNAPQRDFADEAAAMPADSVTPGIAPGDTVWVDRQGQRVPPPAPDSTRAEPQPRTP